jgi:sulfur relay (sulfurtransferase) complex TusBCD TusD component (DsrE family)
MPFTESFTRGAEYEKDNAMGFLHLIQEQGRSIKLCVNQALIKGYLGDSKKDE